MFNVKLLTHNSVYRECTKLHKIHISTMYENKKKVKWKKIIENKMLNIIKNSLKSWIIIDYLYLLSKK